MNYAEFGILPQQKSISAVQKTPRTTLTGPFDFDAVRDERGVENAPPIFNSKGRKRPFTLVHIARYYRGLVRCPYSVSASPGDLRRGWGHWIGQVTTQSRTAGLSRKASVHVVHESPCGKRSARPEPRSPQFSQCGFAGYRARWSSRWGGKGDYTSRTCRRCGCGPFVSGLRLYHTWRAWHSPRRGCTWGVALGTAAATWAHAMDAHTTTILRH